MMQWMAVDDTGMVRNYKMVPGPTYEKFCSPDFSEQSYTLVCSSVSSWCEW